jgi:LPS sulfotransferase NodH
MTQGPRVRDDVACYTIAFTYRSGSNVLCDYLAANGVGVPAEYFQYPHGVANRASYDELGVAPEDFRTFLPWLLAARSRNGLFGSKMTWDQRNVLAAAVRRHFPGCEGPVAFGRAHRWVWLRRRDKIAQAVSLWRAIRSGRWTSAGEAASDRPAYDYFRIVVGLYAILTEEYCWEEYFRHTGVEPVCVFYEDLLTHPAAVVSAAVRALEPLAEVPLTAAREEGLVLASALAVQRDAYSAEIASRMREDLAHLGVDEYWEPRAATLGRWMAFFDREGWKGEGDA